MQRTITKKVVVITGASSGIGKVTALVFARQGARLVLAARRQDALDEAARECRQAGAEAIACRCDVTSAADVSSVARQARERFGAVDVWVNNAAVLSFGAFLDTPLDVHERVLHTNLFGYMYGARAALTAFREQGHGVLINNSTVVAQVSEPYVSAYVASQHAVRGLSMSLRQELQLVNAGNIHVCVVMPASIDTPFFNHAANFTGRAVKAMPPVYPPDDVADAIVRCAAAPRREVYVGHAARKQGYMFRLLPALIERRLAAMFDQQHLYQDKHAPHTLGNVLEPSSRGEQDRRTRGGWQTPDGRHCQDVDQSGRGMLPTTLAAGALATVAGLAFLRLSQHAPPDL
jgi:short-subunit dehydrogenase